MEQIEADFKKLLLQHGYSYTKARVNLFNLLLGKEPLSMHKIVNVAADFSDRATVYRNIELFERLGIVNRLQIGWKYKIELSDQFHPHHHHISCSKCGKIENLQNDTQLEEYLLKESNMKGFRLTGHMLELYGICADCLKT